MNAKTAKLIRKFSTQHGTPYRHNKRIWRQSNRIQRTKLRVEMLEYLL